MKYLNNFIFALTLMAAGLAGSASAEVSYEELTIGNAWVRAMPPSAEHTAAYLDITNSAEEDVTLVEVRSEASETVEIHVMETVDGVMNMRQVESLVIPHGETVALAPGGTHIMLIDLIEPLTEGETVELILVFADGMERPVNAVIQKEMFSDEESGSDDAGEMDDDDADEVEDDEGEGHDDHDHGDHEE